MLRRSVPVFPHNRILDQFIHCVPGFDALEQSDQEALVEMFWYCVIHGRGGHNDGTAAISVKPMTKIWGSVERMKSIVQHKYFSCLQGSNFSGEASNYSPCEEMEQAYYCLVKAGATSKSRKVLLTKRRTHAHVVEAKTSSGARRHGKGQPSSMLPINIQGLNQCLDRSPCKLCRRAALRFLYLEQQSPHPGAIPMRYCEVRAGRIFDRWGIQNASRSVRSVALAGMYDYDISNCHLAIVRELAGRLGLLCPALDRYLANKKEFRERVAAYVNEASGTDSVEADAVKKAIIQLAYGAPLSTSTRVSLSTVFPNRRARQAFRSHPEVQLIVQELRHARHKIVKSHISEQGRIQNAFGVRDCFELPKEYDRALSFVVTGVEALALDAILQRWGESILLAMHDGWIVREAIPTEEFEAEIERKTGFPLQVELKERLAVQDKCDHDCAPIDGAEFSEENQRFIENSPDSLETKARRVGGSCLLLCRASSLFSGVCPLKTGVPSWGRELGEKVGLWVTARPQWNLPPHLKTRGSRGGGRRKRVSIARGPGAKDSD